MDEIHQTGSCSLKMEVKHEEKYDRSDCGSCCTLYHGCRLRFLDNRHCRFCGGIDCLYSGRCSDNSRGRRDTGMAGG